jgi:hypothetical protein
MHAKFESEMPMTPFYETKYVGRRRAYEKMYIPENASSFILDLGNTIFIPLISYQMGYLSVNKKIFESE